MKMIIPYVAALVVFVGVDLIWLGLIARSFYRNEMGALMTDNFNVWAGAAFYLLYPLGMVIFAIAPTLASGTWRDALLWGALFGFFAYATYDLTNLAVVKAWPVRLTIVDLLWGTCLTAVAAASAHVITRGLQQTI